ncbi:MAG: hypothetical protein K0R78_1651 [Pelosinus sp.]|jgi:hypothetical protein|nr:hypothetical protein [Pelosinus sp.]
MMTKLYCHDGYCEPISRENRESHSKMESAEPFISSAVILFLITFVALAICIALVRFVTL